MPFVVVVSYCKVHGECQKVSQIKMFGYKRVNRNVLSRCLKTSSDCADVTCDGRSFPMLGQRTGGNVTLVGRVLRVAHQSRQD